MNSVKNPKYDERNKCIKEVKRVLKNNGLIFASYIPYLSGSIAILDRYFRHPEQVDKNNIDKVFNSGKFVNNSENGFQEGDVIQLQKNLKNYLKQMVLKP